MNSIILLLFLVPACVYAQYNCKDPPACLTPPSHGDGFLSSEKDIQDTCAQYNAFVTCVDGYGKQCWGNDFEKTRDNTVAGVKGLNKVCTDENYRKDYLKEVATLGLLQAAFGMCSLTLTAKSQVASLLEGDEKSKGVCCAVESFEQCANSLCVGKCTPDASKILKDAIATKVASFECDEDDRKRWTDCLKKDGPNGSSTVSFNFVYFIGTIVACALLR